MAHTVGIERLAKATLAVADTDYSGPLSVGMLAVVERFDGDLVKVCMTSADVRRTWAECRRWGMRYPYGARTITATLSRSGKAIARRYGAFWIG